jgi:hypothetical protein
MKRMILSVVAMLSMTMAFAEDENVNNVNNVNVYDMSVNYYKLGEALGLNIDQMESVEDVHKAFCADMMNAAVAAKDDRKAMVDKAIDKDLKYMHYILSDNQYRKYLTLLNVTMNNRGLNK